jgi:hypothetical protein
MAYETAMVIGLRRSDGKILLNPPGEMVLETSDTLILIAEDDSTITRAELDSHAIELEAIQPATPAVPLIERTLLLGWNQNALPIITMLDAYVSPGSEITVMVETATDEIVNLQQAGRFSNQHVTVEYGSTTDRRTLERLGGGHEMTDSICGYALVIGKNNISISNFMTTTGIMRNWHDTCTSSM